MVPPDVDLGTGPIVGGEAVNAILRRASGMASSGAGAGPPVGG